MFTLATLGGSVLGFEGVDVLDGEKAQTAPGLRQSGRCGQEEK